VNKLLILFSMVLVSCDYRSCQDWWFPADMYLETPTGSVRIHCSPDCPEPKHILQAMTLVEDQMSPFTDVNMWNEWDHFAITFGDQPLVLRDGRKASGATWQDSQRIYIFSKYPCGNYPDGICPGVLGWELKLPIVNRELGGDWAEGNDEQAKIKWLTERGIEHIMWTYDGENINGVE
jgi:hypothetical protein